jgi:hypothetical protein
MSPRRFAGSQSRNSIMGERFEAGASLFFFASSESNARGYPLTAPLARPGLHYTSFKRQQVFFKRLLLRSLRALVGQRTPGKRCLSFQIAVLRL